MINVSRTGLTKDILQRLLQEKRRTQCGSVTLLKDAKEVPPGLTPMMVDSWLDGRVKTAAPEHLQFVLDAYAHIPDGEGGPNKPIKNAAGRVRITAELRTWIEEVHAQAPKGYLQQAPKGLTQVRMAHILSGRNKTMSREALEHLEGIALTVDDHDNRVVTPDLAADSIQPPRSRAPLKQRPRTSVAGIEYIEITDELYQDLHAEVRRSLVSPRRLLEDRRDAPEGFEATTAMRWYQGTLRAAERDHWDCLMRLYAALPDAT